MIILHVIISSKGVSGSEKYVIDLIKHQKKFFKVFVITLKKNKKLNFFLNKETKVFAIENYFKKFRIKRIINKLNPNIIHTHLGGAVNSVEKSLKYKVISTMHMNYKKKIYKNTDAIIVSNKSQFNEIKKTFKGKLFKSNLWINLPKKNINKLKLKKKLNIPKKNLVFGSIGRFHPQKGFDFLIECFQELKLKNATIVLIGNGHNEYSNLEKQNKNFKIIGHVDNVSNYYNIFDICLFASRWETFGYTLVEAMYFNLPILSTKHLGNKDWLDNFDISQFSITKKKNFKKIIKKLYILNPIKKKYDLSMFDYENNCKAVTSIYKKILVE